MLQRTHHVFDGRGLLANRDINAGHVLTLLVDDRVNGHGGFAGLTVTNDQLALTATHRNHGVDGLQAGLHGLVHRLTRDHARCNLFNHVGHLGVNRAFAVDRLTQRVDHTTLEFGAHRHFQNTARALDGVAFGNVLVSAQNHGADRITLQIQCQTVAGLAVGVGREFQHFALHHVRKAMDAANTVGHGNDRTLIANVGAGRQAINSALDQFRNFCGIELHDSFLLSLIGKPARAQCPGRKLGC